MRPLPTAVFVSFRLGGTDGVSIEAGKWERALRGLGFATRRVAGEILDAGRPDDVVLPELAMTAGEEPRPDAVEEALDGAALVVVENLLSLPLNLPAARAVSKVVAGHERVVLHHHDLPWQRDETASIADLPPDLPGALHVTINDRSRDELAERGIRAHTVRNHFDFSAPEGHRSPTRERLGLGDDDLLLLHPVRAIRRKNVPAALDLAEAVAARLPRRSVCYWLPGPAEDGYADDLADVLRRARVDVCRRQDVTIADAYAACDLVVFPSTWEGFGNPVVESIVARRPLAVARYPVLDELTALGLELLSVDEPERVAAVLAGRVDLAPQLEANRAVAARHLSLARLPGKLRGLLEAHGWRLPMRP